MYQFIAVILFLAAAAYTLGLTNKTPNFDVAPGTTVPQLARQVSKYNPYDLSPGDLEGMSKKPYTMSVNEMGQRSKHMQEVYVGQMDSMTKNIDIGSIWTYAQTLPAKFGDFMSQYISAQH